MSTDDDLRPRWIADGGAVVGLGACLAFLVIAVTAPVWLVVLFVVEFVAEASTETLRLWAIGCWLVIFAGCVGDLNDRQP